MAALDFPSSPTNGQVFGNWTYNSTKQAWQSNPLTPAKTVNSPTAPTSPAAGDQWFNTNNGSLYIYYTDANTSQWVESRAPITADGYISPNYIINGAFDFWQRGTSSTNNTAYLADRWAVTGNATGLQVNQSRVSTTIGAKLGYALRVVQAVSATSVVELAARQPLERSHMEALAGKTVTVSFWYRSNKVGTHGVRIIGTGGSNVGGVDFNAGITVSTADTWQRYSVTSSTSFSGITSWGANDPTSVGGYVDIGFRVGPSGSNVGFSSLSANDYFELTGVQLEEGALATPFRRNSNSIAGELAACQRYYEKSYNQTIVPGTYQSEAGCMFMWGSTQSDGFIGATVNFKAQKRISTYTFTTYPSYNTATANNVDVFINSVWTPRSRSLLAQGDYSVGVYAQSGVNSGVARLQFQWVCDAEL